MTSGNGRPAAMYSPEAMALGVRCYHARASRMTHDGDGVFTVWEGEARHTVTVDANLDWKIVRRARCDCAITDSCNGIEHCGHVVAVLLTIREGTATELPPPVPSSGEVVAVTSEVA